MKTASCIAIVFATLSWALPPTLAVTPPRFFPWGGGVNHTTPTSSQPHHPLSLPYHATNTTSTTTQQSSSSFTIEDGDEFYLDGRAFQIISGAVHYFRIQPSLWEDRLVRIKALGLNTIEVYIPWNYHEPHPGLYWFGNTPQDGSRDVDAFIALAHKLGFYILLRAGPYMCGEWDGGGLPAWLASSAVTGGGQRMRLRSHDPLYLSHVDRWWRTLLPRFTALMRTNGGGGPILMVQIENEFGLCGGGNDAEYLRYLATLAREILGPQTILFTTDPAGVAAGGTLPGDEVFTAVDFGPAWFDYEAYYGLQKALNAPGKSPPMNTEMYTGWLTHWGESMANTSALQLAQDVDILLQYTGSGNGSSSTTRGKGGLNFYMVHGGTNFGLWPGANADQVGGKEKYEPCITSYDYGSPLSEAGSTGQPGIGGDGNKYHLLRSVIQQYNTSNTRVELMDVPPEPVVRGYGGVGVRGVGGVMEVGVSAPHASPLPLPMEEYGQQRGWIVYKRDITNEIVQQKYHSNSAMVVVVLDLGDVAPHDYTYIFVNGRLYARMDRSSSPAIANFTLNAVPVSVPQEYALDIVVQAMGRRNFGCDGPQGVYDTKGLQNTTVLLNGTLHCCLLSFICTGTTTTTGWRRKIQSLLGICVGNGTRGLGSEGQRGGWPDRGRSAID